MTKIEQLLQKHRNDPEAFIQSLKEEYGDEAHEIIKRLIKNNYLYGKTNQTTK